MAYRSRLDELQQAVRDAIASPLVTYVLVTAFTNPWKFAGVQSDLAVGLSVARGSSRATDGVNGEETTADDILAVMGRQGTEPFAYLGSSRDAHEPRWLLYRFATVHTPAGGVYKQPMCVQGCRIGCSFASPYGAAAGTSFFIRPTPVSCESSWCSTR